MAGHHDPQVLYEIQNVSAFHIQNGQEQPLNTSGGQTLTLLMVPTHSPFADLSTTVPQNEIPDEDFYLHLHLAPEVEIPLPANTQVFHKPPRGYLIPRRDLGAESGAWTRIQFPEKATQDDIDTFETILAQCTAFMERAPPPTGGDGYKPYNPAEYAAGGKLGAGKTPAGQIVLIDEDDGSIVGELGPDANIVEDPSLSHGSKNPVEIQIDESGNRVDVRPVSEDYLRLAKHPAYKDSSLVQNAATASRLIVTGSSYLGNLMASGADSFTQKTKPVAKPLTFKEGTHDRVRKIHSFTAGGADLSSKTVGQVTKYAQNFGAKMAGRKKDRVEKGFGTDGKPIDDYKPGLLNKSMIAFSTIADGIAHSGRDLLTQSGAAATTMVGHRYGAEAGGLTAQLAGGVKNVGLVYIDVTGVSRRAVIKSVAKGMVVGKVRRPGGQVEDVIVGGGDGGAIPQDDVDRALGQDKKGAKNNNLGTGEPDIASFGNRSDAAPPSYYASEKKS